MIGIVGGIGPLAGADLYKKIVENTEATVDQDHVPVLLASLPGEIPGRPEFLLGQSAVNPGPALARVVLLLERAGAQLIGIACNTAHAPPIFDAMRAALDDAGSRAQIVHLLDETNRALLAHPAAPRRVGVLCTSGAYRTQLFQNKLREAGLEAIMLDFERHDMLVQPAISSIKIVGLDISPGTLGDLNTAIGELKNRGAQALLLGCTELSVIADRLDFRGLPAVNPSTVLARALIEKWQPEKLKKQAMPLVGNSPAKA